MKARVLLSALLLCLISHLAAQTMADRVHIEEKEGANMSRTDYSKLKNRSPKSFPNGTCGLFMEFEFGESRLFPIRPEIDIINIIRASINNFNLDERINTTTFDIYYE